MYELLLCLWCDQATLRISTKTAASSWSIEWKNSLNTKATRCVRDFSKQKPSTHLQVRTWGAWYRRSTNTEMSGRLMCPVSCAEAASCVGFRWLLQNWRQCFWVILTSPTPGWSDYRTRRLVRCHTPGWWGPQAAGWPSKSYSSMSMVRNKTSVQLRAYAVFAGFVFKYMYIFVLFLLLALFSRYLNPD